MYSVPDLILRVESFHKHPSITKSSTRVDSTLSVVSVCPSTFTYLTYLPKATSSSSHVIAIKASAYPSSERGRRPSIELLSWALSWLSEHLAWPSQILCQWWIWNRNNLFCLDLFVVFIGKMNEEWILCVIKKVLTYLPTNSTRMAA